MTFGSRRRTFAALIDQDSVALIEYRHEANGFRVVGARQQTRRFETIDVATDAIVSMLASERAPRASLAIAIQHFGAVYHSIVLPQAPDEVVRPIVEREIQRAFNLVDPIVAFTRGVLIDRRLTARSEASKSSQQMIVAAVPRDVITSLKAGLDAAGVVVDVVTVVPETLRQVYAAIDGSKEPTAMLVCLASGPHLAFFIDGQLEVALEPPIALEGERTLDPDLIVDQVERGGVFLRQQARGATASRLLLAAQTADYAGIAAALERRTKLVVQSLAQSVGAPEAIIAMGAVLDARSPMPLDLFPRTPPLGVRLRAAVRGRTAIPTTVAAIATASALWAGVEFSSFEHVRHEVTVQRDSIAAMARTAEPIRESAIQRAGAASIRTALDESATEERRLRGALEQLAAATPSVVQLDSVSVHRTPDGWRTSVRLHATAPTGAEAIRGITGLYDYLNTHAGVRNLAFSDPPVWGAEGIIDSLDETSSARGRGPVRVSVSLSFLAPIEEPR